VQTVQDRVSGCDPETGATSFGPELQVVAHTGYKNETDRHASGSFLP